MLIFFLLARARLKWPRGHRGPFTSALVQLVGTKVIPVALCLQLFWGTWVVKWADISFRGELQNAWIGHASPIPRSFLQPLDNSDFPPVKWVGGELTQAEYSRKEAKWRRNSHPRARYHFPMPFCLGGAGPQKGAVPSSGPWPNFWILCCL